MIATLLTLFAIGLVTLIVAGIVLSILGTVFSLAWGLATFLLLKVAPLIFLGWVVLKLADKMRGKNRRISAADRRWLDDT